MVAIQPIEKLERIEIDREGAIELAGDRLRAVNDAWLDLCAANPRYFNGSILVFTGYDARSGVIRARAEQYKHHAVRDAVDLGLSLLSVTAILCAPGRDGGRPVYFLGRRAPHTHRYGGLWELGPSGGIDVPDHAEALEMSDLVAELAREVREEIGVDIGGRPCAVRALIHDAGVGSTDIALEAVLAEIPALRMGWEYTQTRWVTLDELVDLADRSPEELIPTTVALARFLHEARG